MRSSLSNSASTVQATITLFTRTGCWLVVLAATWALGFVAFARFDWFTFANKLWFARFIATETTENPTKQITNSWTLIAHLSYLLYFSIRRGTAECASFSWLSV